MVLRHLKIVLLSESKYTFFIVPFIYSRKDKLICRDRRQLNIDQLLPALFSVSPRGKFLELDH